MIDLKPPSFSKRFDNGLQAVALAFRGIVDLFAERMDYFKMAITRGM